MGDILRYTGVLMTYSGLLCFFISLIYFAIIKKRYDNLISQYRSHGFFMKQFDILASSSGFFGSVSVTYFFWQLLTHKRIRLSRTEFLGDEPYNFIASFKKKDTQWIKRYFYLFITWFGLVCLGGILIYLPDWLQLR